MAVWCYAVFFLLFLVDFTRSTTSEDMDYGGIPLWINRILGEPSVLSLQGRINSAWIRANNPLPCPELCDCPVQWPSALYCDHRGLTNVSEALPETTQYLFLQGNNISSLSSSLFSNISGLRWLFLDHNQLKTLDLTALQNQTDLCYLFVNNNHLSSVPSSLPLGLRQLRLAQNRIRTINPGAFTKLHKLTLLLLQGNRLKTIKEEDFSGLLGLNLLDLSGNLFTSVPKHLPPSIEQLYLSNNSLSSLEQDSFVGYPDLKYLRLGHCGLKSGRIHPDAFNVTSLVELDMSYNKLSTTPSVPSSLQYLYLEANNIQEMNLTSFCREEGPMSYSRIKILRLDGNRLTPQQLPPDWVYCFRVLQRLYI